MCSPLDSSAISAALAAKSFGNMPLGAQSDPRAISPTLQARLDATAANPGSAQPTYGMTGATAGSPVPARGGFIGKLGQGIASTVALRGAMANRGGFTGNLGAGLSRAFASAPSATPGGRIVS